MADANKRPALAERRTAMWLWGTLLGIVALLAVIVVVVDRRRGPSDNSQGSLDFNVTNRTGAGHDGEWNGPISGSGGGAG